MAKACTPRVYLPGSSLSGRGVDAQEDFKGSGAVGNAGSQSSLHRIPSSMLRWPGVIPVTTAGSYTFSVAGTDASNPKVTVSENLTITVQ